MTNLDSVLKSIDITLLTKVSEGLDKDKGLDSQSYSFFSSR